MKRLIESPAVDGPPIVIEVDDEAPPGAVRDRDVTDSLGFIQSLAG